ncbi:acyl-CoA dehydrogenase/oxidase C-terminal [Dichomitus squalens]|uniref:Acyl-CoA dehydrogenase/oxidase C-terminal n=1 Tax=Dichomitus squalens TaxID=114155 RepID=A0A4Q9MEZ4_9APHY|nr:acyl-CoA dehydrogenase/oxidase C-terminal [Dichomitus squalens]
MTLPLTIPGAPSAGNCPTSINHPQAPVSPSSSVQALALPPPIESAASTPCLVEEDGTDDDYADNDYGDDDVAGPAPDGGGRCLSIARASSTVRAVEGGKTLLKDVPMHVAGLVEITLLYKALANLTFGAIGLLGRSECGLASAEEEARLRLLTPTIKGYAAHWATAGMEQAMGALGGLGYMEEAGIGRLIRDAMVEKIWEGTISVCALDLTRAVSKEPKAVTYYIEWGRSLIQAAQARLHSPALQAVETLSASLQRLPIYFGESVTNALLTTPLLNYFAAISCALYLLEHATWSRNVKEASSEVDLEAFRRWVEEGEIAHTHVQMTKAREDYHRRIALNSKIVYGGDVLAAKL